MKINAYAAAILLLVSACESVAAVPSLLTYQGRLKESGQAISANRTVEIYLCDAESAGNCFSTGAQSVTVSNGLFRSTFTVPSTVNVASGEWYLELWVSGNRFSPREFMTSSAYSLVAGTAAYASNLAAASGASGIYASSDIYLTGGKYYGDGSALTGIQGDDLGSHLASKPLNMAGYPVVNVSSVSLNGNGVASSGPVFLISGATFAVLNNGNLGVGVSAPLDLVHMKGGNPWLRITDTDGSTSGSIGMANNTMRFDEAGVGNRMALDINNGRLGIGTLSPGYALDVQAGSINASGSLCLSGDCRASWAEVTAGGSGDNLGDHTATQNLNMSLKDITGVSSMTVSGAISIGISIPNTGEHIVMASNNPWLRIRDTDGTTSGSIGMANNTMRFDEAGVGNRMALEITTGRLGIGTLTPGYSLDVQGGNINTSGSLCLSGDCKASWGEVVSGVSGDNLGSHIATQNLNMSAKSIVSVTSVTLSGAIGIGTSNPAYSLDVQGGNINTSGSLCLSGDCKANWAEVTSGGSGDNLGDHTATNTLNMSDKPVIDASSMSLNGYGVSASGPVFQINGATFAVLNNGNLGVGVAAPLDLVHMKGGNPWLRITDTDGTTSGSIGMANNVMRFDEAGVGNRMALDISNGRLGIGTLSPGYQLDVAGSARVTGNVLMGLNYQVYQVASSVLSFRVGCGVSYNLVSGGCITESTDSPRGYPSVESDDAASAGTEVSDGATSARSWTCVYSVEGAVPNKAYAVCARIAN